MGPRIGDAAELVANRLVNRIALSLPADLSSDIFVAHISSYSDISHDMAADISYFVAYSGRF